MPLHRDPLKLSVSLCRSVFTGIVILLLAGCTHESASNAELGKTCTLGFDAGERLVYDPQAPECQNSLCLQMIHQSTEYFDTAPYCTTTCSSDSDCHGQKRDGDDPDDHRCIRGYTCGVLATVGPLCCQKLCVCKDFLPWQGLRTPDVCLPGDDGRVSCGDHS